MASPVASPARSPAPTPDPTPSPPRPRRTAAAVAKVRMEGQVGLFDSSYPKQLNR